MSQLQSEQSKRQKAEAHRPARVPIEDRINIATIQASYHVAAKHACQVFWLLKNRSVEQAPCKETALAYLLEVFYCCYYQSVIELSEALNIDMALDGSGKQFSRQFLCISFTANFKGSKAREKRVYALYEFTTGGAEKIVSMVIMLVSYIHNIQKSCNYSPMRLNDIKSVTLDNCNENRGYKNGVAALLQQKRKQEWHALNGETTPYIPMAVKGCDDHKANLVSTYYEQQLVKREKYWGRNAALSSSGDVHLATIVIKGVISTCQFNNLCDSQQHRLYAPLAPVVSPLLPQAGHRANALHRGHERTILHCRYCRYVGASILFSDNGILHLSLATTVQDSAATICMPAIS